MNIASIAILIGVGLAALFAMKILCKALIGLVAFVALLLFIAYDASSSHGPILNPSLFASN
ncbi:MAG: hypothetical protein ABWZ40_11815 [Caulobacterales bacterium]